jgi:hypothetical protein
MGIVPLRMQNAMRKSLSIYRYANPPKTPYQRKGFLPMYPKRPKRIQVLCVVAPMCSSIGRIMDLVFLE